MSKTQLVIVTGNPFKVVKTKTGESITLSAAFKTTLLSEGKEAGKIYTTMQDRMREKIAISLNLTAAFAEYKRITKNGFPGFVHDLLDPSCPKSYGKVGSDDRKELNSHSVFNGLSAMLKSGDAALTKMKERKALSDAGLDPDDSEKVQEHKKEERDNKRDAVQAEFVRCMVGFDTYGVTETTVDNLLIWAGKHEKGNKEEVNKVGATIRDAAIKGVFAKRERTTKNVTPKDKDAVIAKIATKK